MNVLVPVVYNYSHSNMLAIGSFLCAYFTFFTSTWEEYHTGTLYLDYISGPSEGAWAVVLSSLISFFFGPQFWDAQLFGIQIKWIVPLTFIFGGLSTSFTSINRSLAVKKSLSTLLAQLIVPAVYLFSCLFLAFLWIPQQPALAIWFIFLSGFPACFRISSTILAHITKSPLYPFYPIELVPILLITLKFLLPELIGIAVFKSAVIICSIVYFTAMIFIIRDICTFLDINCLSIKHKLQRQKQK